MSLAVESATVIFLAICAGLVTYITVAIIGTQAGWFRANLRLAVVVSSRKQCWMDWLFFGVTCIFFLIFVLIDLRRYETLSFFGDDFAFFNQAIWNSLHGRLLENTAYLDSPTILGHHFSPILLALVPLYVFGTGPRVLSVLPAITITVSAFPLYWFARQQIGRTLALVILVAFFLSPIVQYLGTGPFYEIILATPLLMYAVFFLLRYRYFPFWVCLALALLVKEEIGIMIIGIGIYVALFQRKGVLGLLLASIGLFSALALLLWVIPAFQGGTNYYFWGGSSERPGLNLYGYLGKNLGEIGMTVITRPDVVFQYVIIESKIEALLYLLLPVGAIPLIGTEIIALALLPLAYILLTDAPWVYSPYTYHYAPVVPFLFFGLVVGVRRIISWVKGKSSASSNVRANRLAVPAAVGVFILASSVLSAYVYNQRQSLAILDFNRYPVTEHTARAETIAQMIPDRAVVLAQTELMPLVSERRYAYIMPAIPCLGMADYVFADMERPWYGYRKDIWEDVLRQPIFESVLNQDGYVLRKRTRSAHVVDVNFGNRMTLLGYTSNLTRTLTGGFIFHPALTWRIDHVMREQYVRIARVTDEQGHLWAMDEGIAGGGDCTTDRLDEGTVLSDLLRLDLPPTMPGGRYGLSVGLYEKVNGEYLPVVGEQKNITQTEIFMTALAIEKNKASFTASQLRIEQPLFVDMGEMRFLGSTFFPGAIRSGEEMSVGLYWRARGKPRGDYLVAVQLRDAAGRIVAEQKDRPAAGAYPTTQWSEGEVLLDWHDWVVPATLAPGEYAMQIVLSDAVSGKVLGETALAKISITDR
jgi:uncharacterized membrane protein